MAKLGQLLVARGWITVQQLTRALQNQNGVGGRLGTCLLEMDVINEDTLLKALSEQLGVPAVALDDLRGIPEEVLQLIPEKLARRCRAIPFRVAGGRLDMAMQDPRNLASQDELAFACGKRVKVHVAHELRVVEALDRYYHEESPSRYTLLLDRLNRARFLWQPEKTQPLDRTQPLSILPPIEVLPEVRFDDRFDRPVFAPAPLPEPALAPTPRRGRTSTYPILTVPPPQAPPPREVLPSLADLDLRPAARRRTGAQSVVAPPPAPPAPPVSVVVAEEPPVTLVMPIETLAEQAAQAIAAEAQAAQAAEAQAAPPAAVSVAAVADSVPQTAPPPEPVPAEPEASREPAAPPEPEAPDGTPTELSKTSPLPVRALRLQDEAPTPPTAPAAPPAVPSIEAPAPAAAEPEAPAATEPEVQTVPPPPPGVPSPTDPLGQLGPLQSVPPHLRRTVVLTPEELADLVGTEVPPPVSPPAAPGSIAEVESAFAAADDLEAVGRTVLAFMGQTYRRTALFQVSRDKVTGWMAQGEGIDPDAFRRFTVGFDRPSVFLNLRQGSGLYLGPLPPMPAHRELALTWGGGLPRDCVVLPVRMKDRLVTVIYADGGSKGLGGVDLEQLTRLTAVTALAFERSILSKKKQRDGAKS